MQVIGFGRFDTYREERRKIMTSCQKLLGKLSSRTNNPCTDTQPLYTARVLRELQRLERDCRRLKNRMLANEGELPANRL